MALFRDRGLHSGDCVDFTDFGDAIVWQDGFVRDEVVREALTSLLSDGLVVEASAGLELTDKGESQIYAEPLESDFLPGSAAG